MKEEMERFNEAMGLVLAFLNAGPIDKTNGNPTMIFAMILKEMPEDRRTFIANVMCALGAIYASEDQAQAITEMWINDGTINGRIV